MLTVFQYGDIRRAHRDGMSIREIARTFHHSRKKVRQILAEGEPQPYTHAADAGAGAGRFSRHHRHDSC